MATIGSAQEKLAIKQRAMAANYFDGMGAFFGVPANAIASSAAGRAYSAKIEDPGMPNRWATNLRRAFGV